MSGGGNHRRDAVAYWRRELAAAEAMPPADPLRDPMRAAFAHFRLRHARDNLALAIDRFERAEAYTSEGLTA